MNVKLKIFGEEAKELASLLGLEKSGDHNDINTKIVFTYVPVEGHSMIDVEFDV